MVGLLSYVHYSFSFWNKQTFSFISLFVPHITYDPFFFITETEIIVQKLYQKKARNL